MKVDLTKLLTIVWLVGSAYILFQIWANISYLASMAEAYMQLALSHIRK